MCGFRGYSYSTVKSRLKRGWGFKSVISEPLKSDSRVI